MNSQFYFQISVNNIILVAMPHSVENLLYAVTRVDFAVEFTSDNVLEQFATRYSIISFSISTIVRLNLPKTQIQSFIDQYQNFGNILSI